VGNVGEHAKIVHEKWRLRQLAATCQRISAECYADVGEVQAFIDGAEQAVYDIARVGTARQQIQPIDGAIKSAFEQINAAAERGDRITGVPTGYDRLDGKTAGLHEGDLVIVAARPGMGKTSFVLNIATNVASPVTVVTGGRETYKPGQAVCVFSLEMPREQLASRMVCSEARVDLGRLRQGHLHADDWRKLTESAAYLTSLPLWIDDTPAIGLAELRSKVRRVQAHVEFAMAQARARGEEHPNLPERVGVVAVDYLQLMKGRDDVSSREQEISEISRGLKGLAKELKVPVIALSQLNRAVETRSTKDKRPQLSDLRESGAIEQDADTIIFIYRDDYYNPETSDLKGIAELIIAKQRNGPTGKVKVRFSASCTRFDNLEPGDYPEANE
jgi:replicative DNA helicase